MKRPLIYALLGLIAPLFWISPASAEASFEYGGDRYQGASMPAGLRQQFYELQLEQVQQQRRAINQYVVNRYLRDVAAEQGIDLRQAQAQLLSVPRPDDETVKAFYDRNQARIKAPFEQVRERIAEFIYGQRRAQQEARLMQRIVAEKGYRLSLSLPSPPRFQIETRGYPFKGPEDAPVTLVEFADYQCPHCKQAAATVEALLKRYDGQLKVVYRDFPINPSGISRKVAEGAYCAGQQSRFWEYHDLAYEKQSYLKAIKPEMLAAQLQLDDAAFARCLADPQSAEHVEASALEAERLGLTGTPSFFVNGVKVLVQGDLQEALESAIDGQLATP